MRHTAHGWWLEEAGPATACPPLQEDAWADVAVVGGGFTGLWAAWRLLERAPGARVALLEAEVCGEGPSGRNGGFADHLALAAPRLREIAGDAVARATIEASVDAVRAIGRWCAEEEVDAWFHPGGQIVASAAPAQDGASEDALTACRALGLGALVVPLDADGVRARCAAAPLRAGVMLPHTATVQPARLVRGLRTRLLGRGVAVHERTRVTALRDDRGEVTLETATGGRLRARAAVLATGAWSAALPPLRRALTVTSSHVVLTEPVPDLLEDVGWTRGEAITDERRLVHYFRTTRDDRILFGWGGGRIACGGRIGAREHVDAAVAAQVVDDLRRFFPGLRDRAVTHAWGGPIDASPDHLPVVRTLRGGRTHAAFGYTGNGVGPSRLCGDARAALALDQRDEVTRSARVEPRARELPPEPLRVA
ncbi:MAG TPA: FAD-dependent oxidoreductase, partial [Solirubrobacteraceae bacterium]|nr:FAD-dependent oxidoreductase [Solirubrobacteraceae bacterium]